MVKKVKQALEVRPETTMVSCQDANDYKYIDITHGVNLHTLKILRYMHTQLDIRHCQNLKRLTFGGLFLTDLDLSGCQNLETIEVQDCYSLKSLELPFSPSLQKFTLDHEGSLEPGIIMRVFDTLRQCQSLKKVTIGGLKYHTQQGIQGSIYALRQRGVEVQHWGFGDKLH